MRLPAHFLSFFAAILFVTSAAHADSLSIVLTSSSAGQFDYALNTGTTGAVFNYTAGDSITLSGLSGVTNLIVSGSMSGCFTSSFTATSATLTSTVDISCGLPPGIEFGTFSVFSTSPAGTVSYAIQSSNPGSVNGTVTGPVGAPVPEPGSFGLMGSGLVVLYRASRNKFQR